MQRAHWLRSARWGAFIHFLADTASTSESTTLSAEAWNAQVEAVDVERTVGALADCGAGYLFVTLGQNSGYFCSPNASYDARVGRSPSRCSRRDLIGDFARAATAAGLRMGAYLPSHAPAKDRQAVERLRCTPRWSPALWSLAENDYRPQPGVDERLSDFQNAWQQIIAEWSQRWGRSVSGWWLDGCYFADRLYRHPDAPNFSSLAAALRTGNPEAALAFNSGTAAPWDPLDPEADYTPGECSQLVVDRGRVPFSAQRSEAQLHVLTHLGSYWGQGAPRIDPDLTRSYTMHVVNRGGAMTWDIPMRRDGSIPPEHLRCLAAIGRG